MKSQKTIAMLLKGALITILSLAAVITAAELRSENDAWRKIGGACKCKSITKCNSGTYVQTCDTAAGGGNCHQKVCGGINSSSCYDSVDDPNCAANDKADCPNGTRYKCVNLRCVTDGQVDCGEVPYCPL